MVPGATVVVVQQGPVGWVGVMSNPNLPYETYLYVGTKHFKGMFCCIPF